jgi:hypothetical protein
MAVAWQFDRANRRHPIASREDKLFGLNNIGKKVNRTCLISVPVQSRMKW